MADTFGGSPAADTDAEIRRRIEKTKQNTPELDREEAMKHRETFSYHKHISALSHSNLVGPGYPSETPELNNRMPEHVDTSKDKDDKSVHPSGQTLAGVPTIVTEDGSRKPVEADPIRQTFVDKKDSDEKLMPGHNVAESAIVIAPEQGKQPADAVADTGEDKSPVKDVLSAPDPIRTESLDDLTAPHVNASDPDLKPKEQYQFSDETK